MACTEKHKALSLVCGLHNKFNLRVITAVENRRKKNKFDVAAYNAKLREQYV